MKTSGRYVVIISTLDDRAPYVWQLIDEARKVATVVLVHTKPHTDIPGTITVHAENIHLHYPRWANLGLDQCDGPTAIINDDILVHSDGIKTMLDMVSAGYPLVTLPGRIGATPLTGWCFAIDPKVFRFDEEYRWFYSDDQLWEEAKRDGHRIGVANTAIVHDRGDHGRFPAELRQQTVADRLRFERAWGRGTRRR